MRPRFWLNLTAILILGVGAILSLFPSLNVDPRLQGAIWGGLIAWIAAARANGQGSTPE